MSQITCGDIGLEHAVVLQKALFPLLLKRVNELTSTTEYKSPLLVNWYGRSRRDRFLSSRCSKDFLVQYLDEHPDTLDRVSKPGLFLSAVSEVDLAIRLHEFGLLEEECRKVFVATVTSYAINGEDLYALESHQIQNVFTPIELSEFRERVHTELLPKLAEVRQTWQDNRDPDQRADGHMQPLLDSFAALKEEFADEPATLKNIDLEIERAQQWISDHSENDSKEDRPRNAFGDVETKDHPGAGVRGIFEDIDD